LAAIAVRVAAIAALFLATDHASVPFGSFFGDEEYFIKRSIWLRNVALGTEIHRADLIYAFDDYSQTSYLYLLAFVQVLVGPALYGAHLLGVAASLTASVMLFRSARSAFGRVPAWIGLVLLLFLPSLFAWSISALKEPVYFLLTTAALTLSVHLVRQRNWASRGATLAVIVVVAVALDTVRRGGLAITVASIAGGLFLAFLVRRPRVAIAFVIASILAASVAFSRPSVQFQATVALQSAARVHWGHIATAGRVYHLLDDRFYPDRSSISGIGLGELWRFIVRAAVAYVTVPLPWQVQSRAALAFLPEQILWYLMLLPLVPGLVFAWRRDVVFTSLLLSHALVAAMTVALTSGNIGTLVRHRGFAVPYLVWLSAVGAYELLSAAGRATQPLHTAEPEADAAFRMKPVWP
jgi:hypothetical protein